MSKVKDCREEDAISFFCKNCTNKGILNAISRHDIAHFADLAAIVQKYCAMESTWKTQTKFWDNPSLTKLSVRTKRPHSHKSPDSITKKQNPTTGHGTLLEGWLNGPCKFHSTTDTIPTHTLRACWVLRQVAKSGEDLLINNTEEHHPAENSNTVLTVFKTFASNNRRKRALRSLAEVYHVATINPWSDTLSPSMPVTNLNSEQPEHQPHWSLVQ